MPKDKATRNRVRVLTKKERSERTTMTVKKKPTPPSLYVVFAGDRPSFHVYTAEIAAGWVGKNELTHFVKYTPTGRARTK